MNEISVIPLFTQEGKVYLRAYPIQQNKNDCNWILIPIGSHT